MEKVYGHVFFLIVMLLRKHGQTNGVIHRAKNDESRKRWNKKDGFLTLYIYI